MQAEKVSKVTFAENLKRLMRARGIKNAALGREIGVSHVTIGHYLNGKFVPESQTLKKLADFFKVSMEELLSGADPAITLRAAAALADKFPADTPEKQAAFERYVNTLLQPDARAREAEEKLARLQKLLAEMFDIITPGQKIVVEMKKNLPSDVASNRRKHAKSKRAQLRDVDTVSMAVFNEMGAGAPLMPTDKPTGQMRVRQGRFPADAFAARARGESMTGIGVQDGDLVVLRWTEHQEARPDDIVCVHLFGEGSVLKQLKERGGHRWLVSRNPAHPDICLDCEGEPKGRIQAVMIGKL